MNSLRTTPSKAERLHRALVEAARQAGPGAKLPTLAELRVEHSVSQGLLHQVLEVLEAEQVIERRHGVGLFTRESLRRNIVLVCDPGLQRGAAHSPFWDVLVEAAGNRVGSTGDQFSCHFSLSSYRSLPVQQELAQQIDDGNVQGMVWVAPVAGAAVEWLDSLPIPAVTLSSANRWTVRLDEREALQSGVREVIARGCRRIGLWAPANRSYGNCVVGLHKFWSLLCQELEGHGIKPDVSLVEGNTHLIGGIGPAGLPDGDVPQEKTYDTPGFHELMRLQGLSLDPELVKPGPARQEKSLALETPQEQGYRTAMEVFGRCERDWPDAVVIGHDLMAQGALAAFARLGIVPGRDIQVVTHANAGTPTLLGARQDLFCFEIDPQEVVESLFGLLESVLAGNNRDGASHVVTARLKVGSNLALAGQ